MADVVICYAPDNQASARQLADAIRAEGWTVWYDESPAAGSAGGVTEQILNAKAAVVVWSASAVASEWVRADANVARGQTQRGALHGGAFAAGIPYFELFDLEKHIRIYAKGLCHS